MVKANFPRKVNKKLAARFRRKKNKHRTKRSKLVRNYECPACNNSSVVEVKEGNYVWAKCNYCHLSGEMNKFADAYIFMECDVYCTLVDAYHDSK